MGKLTDPIGWATTTIREVVEEADNQIGHQFDLAELESHDGRDIVLAVISGPHAAFLAHRLKTARDFALAYPALATVDGL